MSDAVQVNVNADVEDYPVLVITEHEGHGRAYAIPGPMLEALRSAEAAVAAIQETIMDNIAERYPDAIEVVGWVRDRTHDRRIGDAQSAYRAEHPGGPEWSRALPEARQRYLNEAGVTPA